MAGLVPVFEISRWSNGLLADELWRLAIGLVTLLGGLSSGARISVDGRKCEVSYF